MESYTYKGTPKRAVCIGTGGVSTGNQTTNVFCVEDAVTTITEIAFSAIGFTDGTKALSVDQWNKAGWHLLEGMGVIGTSEPDKAPEPKKSPPNSNQPKLTTPPPVVPPPTPPDNLEEYSYPPIPEIKIDLNTIPGSGSGPAPVIDLERDTSAEQTGGSD